MLLQQQRPSALGGGTPTSITRGQRHAVLSRCITASSACTTAKSWLATVRLPAPGYSARPSIATGAPFLHPTSPKQRASAIKPQATASGQAPALMDDADGINNASGLGNNAVPFPVKRAKEPKPLQRTKDLLKHQPAVYWQMVVNTLQEKVDNILWLEGNLQAKRCLPDEYGSLSTEDDLTDSDRDNGTTMVYVYCAEDDTARRGQVKVGYTARSWKKRADEHRRKCGHHPQLLLSLKVSFIDPSGAESVAELQVAGKTLEKRLLTALKPLRDRKPCESPKCGTAHREWFIGRELAIPGRSQAPQLIGARHTLVVATAAQLPQA